MLNAVVHKDYSSGIPIQISVYDDRIVFWNPGQLPPDWTLARLLGKHPSTPYNPLLANAFFLSGYIESWGRGIEKIARECKQHGIQSPDYDSGMSGLMLTFHASEAYLALIHPGTTDPKARQETTQQGSVKTLGKTLGKTPVKTPVKTPGQILVLLAKNPEMTLVDVAAKISKSLRAVERACAKLVKEGKLKHEGPQKGGHWKVTP